MKTLNYILAVLALAALAAIAPSAGPAAGAETARSPAATASASASPSPSASAAPVAKASPSPSAKPSPSPSGLTLAAQKRLAERLKAIKGASLATALNHNREEWDGLSPDQKDRFRKEALAFLNESPDQQERLLKSYQKLISLSKERQAHYREIAEWLDAVVKSMSPQERQDLLKMAPDQRARALLVRKAELIGQGKLPPDPITPPVEQPFREKDANE